METMEIMVGMGEIQVAEPPSSLIAPGLGSCIAVTLYAEDARIGGMAHIMLPCIKEAHNKSYPGRFADVGIMMTIEDMVRKGARVQNIRAKIFGGANMFPGIISTDSTMDIGKRNILAVRKELEKHNIKIIAEEVGDHFGRTVLFDTGDGSVLVTTTQLGEREY
jgi:chemotaxis protein CheD